MKVYQDKEWLERMYWDEELSTRQMGKLAGVDGKTIHAQMVKHDVPRRNRKKGGFNTYKDRDWLYQRYIVEEMSTVEIAKIVGRCHETICNWMDKFEIERRDPLTAYSVFLSDEQLEKAIKSYKDGFGLNALAKKYSISYRQIRDNLMRAEVEFRPQNRQYSINEHAFDDLSVEEAAYFAGFLLADGCCFNTVLQVGLALKDRCQIERLRQFMECDNPINSIKQEGRRQARLQCCGIHLSERLKQLGVSNNVSGLVTLRKELVGDSKRHWLRGFHDGDGSATKAGALTFCGKEQVLEFARDLFDPVVGESKTRRIYKHQSANAFYLTYSKARAARLAAEYMYSEATIFLERKWRVITNVWPKTSPGSVPDCAK